MLSFLQPIGDLFHTLFYEPIFNILMLIYGAVAHVLPGPAFGIAIIILTLLMRVCLIPLVRKQLRSQRTMQELQPRIAQLKRQYAGDQQGMLAAQQALFKEHGYSPVSGCLPLVIQMPFLYALYYALFAIVRNTSCTINGQVVNNHLTCINNDIYSFLPHLLAVPQTHFLWLDLAAKDPTFILPVLAALLTFVQLRMAMPHRKPAPGQQKDATSQATQFTQYLMPVMTLIFGLSFPAGLPLYWSVSTGFSAVQQYFLSGFGSLFVGLDRFVPGLARFIPEPQETPSLATASSARGAAGSAAVRSGAARAAIAPPPPAPSGGGGGLRGMWNAIRAQATAQAEVAQQQAQERQAARNGGGSKNAKIVDGSIASTASAAENPATANGRTNGTGAGSSGGRARRPRAERDGAMLVRPSTSASTPPTSKAELPEEAIAREATGLPPEVAATNGTNGAGVKTTGAAASASATRGAPTNGNARPASSAGKSQASKGPNAARKRGNRPKGSR